MKDCEKQGFDISVHFGVCSVYGHSESHYSLQNTSFASVERGRKRPTPIRRVSHFCPLTRLFCSVTLLPQNVLTEPLKKPVLNWAGTLMLITA